MTMSRPTAELDETALSWCLRRIDSEYQCDYYRLEWASVGPLIVQHGVAIRLHAKSGKWFAMLSKELGDSESADWVKETYRGAVRIGDTTKPRLVRFEGATPLIAAARAIVAGVMGLMIDIPVEMLIGDSAHG
jgi:hypothetical protein